MTFRSSSLISSLPGKALRTLVDITRLAKDIENTM